MYQTRNLITLSAFALATASLLTACGGGSSDAPALTAQATLTAAAGSTTLVTSATTSLSSSGGNGTGAVTYAVASGTCTISGTTLTAASSAGTCTVTATKAADSTYSAKTSAALTITVTAVPATVVVVQNQTGSQDSYDTGALTALPGNNTAGGYEFGGSSIFAVWWSGVGTDSVYRGVGMNSTSGAGVGVYVAGAGGRTWNISNSSTVTVGLGTNAECVGICGATIILKSSTPNCIATKNTPFTILTSGVNTGLGATGGANATAYTSTLTAGNWTVTGCTTNTIAAFKALPLAEVHAQILGANAQTTGSAPWANGVNLGGIVFN